MAGKRILIADDDSQVLEVLVRKLREKNYEVMCLQEGKDVIEKCRICNPDLILLDIVMRDVDGYTVARTLREDKSLESTPIIFITAQELEYSVIKNRLAEIGHCDFIAKFRSFDELFAKIKEKIG